MVKVKIDNIDLSVEEGTTILEAAKKLGIYIPHLCYLKGINEISACKVCVVEILGKNKLVTACSTAVSEGMVVFTNSAKVRSVRKSNVELILSQHDCLCATCVRSGNCPLQTLAGHLGIYDLPFERHVTEQAWDNNFPLIRDSKKCIKCMRCLQICSKVQGCDIWDVQNTGAYTNISTVDNVPISNTKCTLCGQCITHCPTGALKERNDLPEIYDILADPNKVTVVQIAPAVRTAWLERKDMEPGIDTEGRLVAALKRMGFDYVLDTVFAADVTIMEEGTELLERLSDNKKMPMFTSCCPGWVSYLTMNHPEMLLNLSTTKSPQQIFGALVKTYFAKKTGVAPENICSISIMPCVSKKREAALDSMQASGYQDVDYVLTTREMVRLLRAEHIDPRGLQEMPFDSPIGDGTGAGALFGVTGGVMEAALRTAYKVVTGEEAPEDAFQKVRDTRTEGRDNAINLGGIRTADFDIAGRTLKTCVVSGLKNAERVIKQIKRGEAHYDFVEVMACPGGCVGGGGQPIHEGCEWAPQRGQRLYNLDKKRKLRRSHENPQVQQLYKDFLEKPLSEKAEKLLHTQHVWEKNYR